jgi:hypothetical protein
MNQAITTRLKPKKQMLWFVLISLCLAPFVWFVFEISIGPVVMADSGFKRARKTINPEELRSWAFEAIRKFPATNGFSKEIPGSEIPASIKNLYSIPLQGAWVNPKSNERAGCVMIIWGGGFFHWGIDIGPTNFVSPINEEYPKAFRLSPGIYYRRESPWCLL